MKKILILGNSGSGKSTFAINLSKHLNIKCLHLDKLVYPDSWDKPEHQNMEKEVSLFVNDDSWIIDGNYLNHALERFDLCDTIFFLDINRFVCLHSVVSRKRKYQGKDRVSRSSKVDEKLNRSFLNWVFFGFYATSRKKIKKLLKETNKKVVILKSRKQVNKYLEELNK